MRMRTNNNNKEGAMTKIIQIEGSPRKDRSHSSKIANEYLKKISEKQDVSVKTIDIWTKDLPEFNGEMMNAKYAVIGGVDPTQEQKAAWEKVTNIFDGCRCRYWKPYILAIRRVWSQHGLCTKDGEYLFWSDHYNVVVEPKVPIY